MSDGDARTLKATPELLAPNLVRLRVHRPAHFSWQPGQSAYLILPNVSKTPLEMHPFTIASIDTASQGQDVLVQTEDVLEAADVFMPVFDYWKELIFLIDVREGFTNQLALAAQRGTPVTVLVDGPYGDIVDLRGDDTVVLLAGGTGVAYTLPLFLDAIKSACFLYLKVFN
jgi:ferric-chelate reductase